MQLKIEINNLTKSPVKKTFVKKAIMLTLEKSGNLELIKKSLIISLAWVSKTEIRRLNRVYRKKDKVTDVLSFCEYDNIELLKSEQSLEIFLGELVLCYDYIEEFASNVFSKFELQKELARIISHGILHLLGFKHGKKMFAIQNVVAEFF